MTGVLILQIFLLVVIAYIVGCVGGCLLHQLFGDGTPAETDDEDALMATTAAARPPVAALVPPSPSPVLKPAAPAAEIPRPRQPPDLSTPVPPAARLDDLKRIHGIGRQNEIRLNAIGITSFSQIAGWTKAQQAEIGERLSFPGRIEREDWVGQAGKLARGEPTPFSERVDKGEVPTSAPDDTAAPEIGVRPKTLKAARNRRPDELTRIKGVGKAIESQLFAIGIFHFSQIAAWSDDHAAWIGNEIGFPGRVERENWIRQAAKLAQPAEQEPAKAKAKPAPKRGASRARPASAGSKPAPAGKKKK